ncbi:MAG: mechanosensitive ion channel family protein [Syntrophomonadaceae bacterium]|nr:mechanosensitive ion channel family protein [Syntrophomonadaceae bacterium]
MQRYPSIADTGIMEQIFYAAYKNMLYSLGGFELINYVKAIVIFLVFLLFSRLLTKYILTWMQNLAIKNQQDFLAKTFQSLQEPLRAFFIVLGLALAVGYLPVSVTHQGTINNIVRSLVIIFIAWCLMRLVDYVSQFPDEIKNRFNLDKILIPFLRNAIHFIIIALAVVVIAQEWDYNVNGFIAGLGLGGLAFALAAQNMLANLFGGMVIITEKPFSLGDWIETPSVEGSVEEITFRSTRVRTYDHKLITVPNSTLANEPITNHARIDQRRMTFHLRVTYSTTPEKMQECIEKLKTMLIQHPDIHNEVKVYFDKFGDSSLDILVDCFAKTDLYFDWLEIKSKVNLEIMKLMADEGVSIALPSRSVYLSNGDVP